MQIIFLKDLDDVCIVTVMALWDVRKLSHILMECSHRTNATTGRAVTGTQGRN